MNQEHYSIKGLIAEHDNYQFSIEYTRKNQTIKTTCKMPSNILSTGLAFALSDLPISLENLDLFLEDVKNKIKITREQQNGTEK